MQSHSTFPASVALGIALASVALACRGRSEPLPTAGNGTIQGSDTASEVVPAANWCGAHGVSESVCTRCNPKLIPGFQAKGDWCQEHGLPESQCTICHPELIEKFRKMAPKVSESPRIGESAGANVYADLRVRLASPETAAKAGIRVERVKEAQVDLSIEAPVRLAFDATRASRVSSPVSGIVREVSVGVGDRVRAQAAVAVVASPELSESSSRLRDAEAALSLATETVEREQQLVAEKISARRDLLEATRQKAAAEAAVASARGALASYGVPANRGLDSSGLLVLRAPRGGVVTRLGGVAGQAATPDVVLVEIQDPSYLWAELDLTELDAGRIREGDEVSLAFDSLPGQAVKGRVEWLSPEVDPTTRTVRARAALANPRGILRAGMFGKARVRLDPHFSIVVPSEAVQDGPKGPVSFVRIDSQVYEPRALRIGRITPEEVEVLAGLRPGEDVVTAGSFLLKTEIMKGSLGAGCCDEVGK